ncbi:metallophosphoesterase [Massilia sp. PWRC2]|uniref:metallophosphoesterase n=1 Tax=Massilia sp. PWRC2 TaxID=2804626 RepID=UPI003CEF0A32
MPRRAFYKLLALAALLHLYLGLRLLPAMALGQAALAAAIGLLLVSSVLVPTGLIVSSLRRAHWTTPLTWAALLSMGLFSSLLLLTVARDLLLLVLTLAGVADPAVLRLSAFAAPLLALALTALGLVNARRLARVVTVEVPIAGLPAALHGYTIVQLSDIHVGPTIKRAYLEAIVARANALRGDAIAITGDLVDGSVAQLAEHTAPLAQLVARDGVFFVTGNHEYYSGAQAWISELRRLGLTVLMNEHVLRERAGAVVMIAGVADFHAHHFDVSHRSDPHQAAAGAPAGISARILLAHQPRSALEAVDAGFHLQLSGHTHGGQFFPWNLLVPLQQPYVAGLRQLRSLWVYTSRGTGYWGPPKRLGAPSEITRVRLVAA